MKEFKFIVTETETGNQIVFENKNYSWFEIYGFAKYIKIQAELKMADIARDKNLKGDSVELIKQEEPKPKTKVPTKTKVEEKPKESIEGKDNVATFEGNANESFITPIDKLGIKTETKVPETKPETIKMNVSKEQPKNVSTTDKPDGDTWF